LVANSLFADGAAAIVLGSSDGDAQNSFWSVKATGSHLFAESADAMSWTIGDHGFEMTLSSRVPELIGGGLAPWVAQWLGSHGMKRDDVATWAVHPGGPKILSSVSEAMQLKAEDLA